MRNVFLKLFNIIFDSGLVRIQRSIGNIIPIYKQKGNKMIQLTIGQLLFWVAWKKLFTCIINNRLQLFFPENQDKVIQCQAGFRKGFFSTIDHHYALHTLWNLYQRSYSFVLYASNALFIPHGERDFFIDLHHSRLIVNVIILFKYVSWYKIVHHGERRKVDFFRVIYEFGRGRTCHLCYFRYTLTI